ncbi:hypothetical protein [Domibacillus robiginosus]|uniref:hypothetical protein n=1 Tax=Domibacillus robiginosus TaxID=1071054 RepID=UPI00067D7F31|nr:hypothetical protein [Domibacillus robiginosus]
MKVTGVFFVIAILAAAFCITLDILLGFTFFEAFMHLIDPLLVMDISEYLVFFLFLCITIGHQITNKKNE